MSTLSLPTEPQNALFTGDIDVYNGITSPQGNGSVYIRNGGLYVEGLTDLDQTTIQTNDGEFNVNGPNKVSINISGGATSSVEIDAEDASYFSTSAGTLVLSADDTGANGKVTITAAGTGNDSLKLEATNATSGQITLTSAGASTTNDAIRLLATDTTDGNVLIQGSGSNAAGNPSVKIYTDNATSGKIQITSDGNSATDDSVLITATGATNGNILMESAGTTNAIELFANNVGGKVYTHTTGTGTDSLHFYTPGGVLIDADGRVYINSDDTTDGVKIATNTAGVPVTIGTSTSLTTVAGNLDITGTFTTINTETLEVEDNFIIVNSGGGEAGIDTGILFKRYQITNTGGSGDVVTHPNPIQESGAFTATATATTFTLGLHASNTNDFYKGWWIKVTSGPAANTVRRIKSYNGTTAVATIYGTADNVVGPPAFTDGADMSTFAVATNTYELYSRPYSAVFYGETNDEIILATVANAPDPISTAGVSTASIQQLQQIRSGAHKIGDQIYKNAYALGAGTTSVTITLRGHGEIVGNKVRITDSYNLTPAIPNGVYLVATVPDANTFTITAPANTTSDDAESSVTVTSMHSSVLYANVIQPFDPDFGGISIPGLSSVEDIVIPRTSTALFTVNIGALYGSYIMLVAGVTATYTSGAYSVFAITANGTNSSVSRLVSVKGTSDERINATWTAGLKPQIYHQPASGAGSPDPYTYRVRIFSAI
jgi:hypothetical protein